MRRAGSRGADTRRSRSVSRCVTLYPRELARPAEHVVDHRLGELAGERVLLARMKAAEQRVGPDRGFGRGGGTPLERSARRTPSQAKLPSATSARASESSFSSRTR